MLETSLRLVASALLLTFPIGAVAQSAWPGKPIRIINPFPAGGQVDVATRILGAKLAPVLEQPVVVETRTGADGIIGTEYVAKSQPDGYTWLAQAVPFTVMVSLRPQELRYDTVRDFQPVAIFATSSLVYVVPATLPVNTLQDFIAYAKSQPGKISYAGSSHGSLAHLTGEMLQQAAGIKMEMIPYPGMPPAIADLVSERTQFMSLGLSVALPQIKAGKLKPLAILDPQRHEQLPDVPTIAESGYPNLATAPWFGLFVPAQTPKEIVQRINKEVMNALRSPEVVEKYKGLGIDPAKPHSTQEFDALVKSEISRWGLVVKTANITAK